jgi:hypothetical protein
MSKTRQRRRLLALRRYDERWRKLAHDIPYPKISLALFMRATQVPFKRQWWPR